MRATLPGFWSPCISLGFMRRCAARHRLLKFPTLFHEMQSGGMTLSTGAQPLVKQVHMGPLHASSAADAYLVKDTKPSKRERVFFASLKAFLLKNWPSLLCNLLVTVGCGYYCYAAYQEVSVLFTTLFALYSHKFSSPNGSRLFNFYQSSLSYAAEFASATQNSAQHLCHCSFCSGCD